MMSSHFPPRSRVLRLRASRVLRLFVIAVVACNSRVFADENDYYRMIPVVTATASTKSRSKNWRPAPKGLVMEVSGIAVLDDKRVAVAIRKGEVWILGNVYDDPPANVTYKRFAKALHEPLGLVKKGDSLYTAQRSELTRLRDTDGDDVADEYLTFAKGWTPTGNYHEYAFGPKLDPQGNFWLTLNSGLGVKDDQKRRIPPNPTKPSFVSDQGRWRGWGMKVSPKGDLIPVSAGFRSPCGLGANAAGDMFATDQQGNWIPAGSLHHMRAGVFFGYPDALAWMNHPDSPVKGIKRIPSKRSYPEAVKSLPQLRPPAVWFPYKKMGQSTTDIVLDNSGGKFGPFQNQLFVGEFTLSSINRVFLEKVNGEYQGACFPFRDGFPCAVLRMAIGTDGSMFVGLTNRGWSSVGSASYGLQRLVWSGKVPFEIKEMRATSDGFELFFTKPVEKSSTSNCASYSMQSYTYWYHETYGSDEILKQTLKVTNADVSDDGMKVKLKIDGMREMFVHELHCPGVRSADGELLLHEDAYYTLNHIPSRKKASSSK